MKKIIKWLDNFWYHNKWIVIIVGFFVVSVTIMSVQLCTKDKYDAMILYTGPRIPSASQTLEICDAFEKVMEEDYDGNGERQVSLNSLFLMTDEQLEDKRNYYDDNGNAIYINTADMVTTRQQFTTQIFVGETLICLLDPAWYDVAKKQDAFVPIAELTDKEFDCMYDDSALYLHQTPFGEYFTAMNGFPEDTLICFRRMSSASGLKNEDAEEERYEYNKRFFIDILEFDLNK